MVIEEDHWVAVGPALTGEYGGEDAVGLVVVGINVMVLRRF